MNELSIFAPEEMLDELVVEANGIEAENDGVRGKDFCGESLGEFALGDAVGDGLLRGDFGR